MRGPNQAMVSAVIAQLQAALERHGDFPVPVVESDGVEVNHIPFWDEGVTDVRQFEVVLRPLEITNDRQLTEAEMQELRRLRTVPLPVVVNPPKV